MKSAVEAPRIWRSLERGTYEKNFTQWAEREGIGAVAGDAVG